MLDTANRRRFSIKNQHSLGERGSEFKLKPFQRSGCITHCDQLNKHRMLRRLGRFVRTSLSFSKCWVMHEACLTLFVYQYNQDRARIILS